jgi:hypothetical protein
VSQYLPPIENIEVGLEQLDKVLSNLWGKKVVVGVDANAKSPLWCSRSINDRREALEAIIAQYGLHVLNQPGQAPTFETTRGRSNINITMASPEIIPLVKSWRVHEDGTSSDHRILETSLDLGRRTSQPPPLLERRYNTRKADWEMFLKIVAEEKSTLGEITLRTAEEVERMAERTQGILRKACNSAIPKKRWHIRFIPWWTAELTRAKRNTYRARRRYQGAKDPATREQEKQRYRQIRREYTEMVTKAKIQS